MDFQIAPGRRVAELPASPCLSRTFVGDPHLVVAHRPASPAAEGYRRIQLRLEQGAGNSPLPRQLTVITSAIPGEGKTTTAMNLALAQAERREHRTLLIGADLRRPSLSHYITPKPTLGLSEVLAGKTPLDRALIAMGDSNLWVLPAGAPSATPLELLQGKYLGMVIADLRVRFDRIVVDAPPAVPFTDAAVLASYADGVLLVVRAGTTTKPLIRRAKESLPETNLLGVVLNDVGFTFLDRYYYGYDDHGPEHLD